MNKSRCLLPILAVAVFPSTAWANGGTPLVWASLLHLVFGNAIIGLIEGVLLAWMFKCSKRKAVLILIAANYASAWIGGHFVAGYLPTLPDITIETIRLRFLAFVLVAFVVTLLIEFPFFWFALRSQKQPLRQALIATPAIHGISYVLLFAWYWMASGTSMMTQVQVVSPDAMTLPEPYSLYYISAKGDEVYQMDLQSLDTTTVVSEVTAHHWNDRLFARPRSRSAFDLLVRLESGERGYVQELLIAESFSPKAPVKWQIAEGHSQQAEGSGFNFGPVPSLALDPEWEFRTGFWPNGISGDSKSGMRVSFSLETPFAYWPVRNATHLSGDFVVFQLGDDQICIMHPEPRRIALITRGKGPIVAKPRTSNRSPEATAKAGRHY